MPRNLKAQELHIAELSCEKDGTACQDISNEPFLWGLARLSHPIYEHGKQYMYNKEVDLSNNWAYVIDTGIYGAHKVS